LQRRKEGEKDYRVPTQARGKGKACRRQLKAWVKTLKESPVGRMTGSCKNVGSRDGAVGGKEEIEATGAAAYLVHSKSSGGHKKRRFVAVLRKKEQGTGAA